MTSKSTKNSSSTKQNSRKIIILSVIFAVAMLASSMIFVDVETSRTVDFLLIAAWFVPFFYLIRNT